MAVIAGLLIGSAAAPAGGAWPVGPAHATGAGGNEPPLVDAGLDQTVPENATVWLDGGGSRDPDGEIVAYRWRIETPDGAVTTPRNASAVRTQFSVDDPGRYAVTLTATDDDGASRDDTLYVTVESRDPPRVTVRGPDTVVAGAERTYVANATDPDGRVERIEWGGGETGEEIDRRFDSPGRQTVAVTVTDDDGLTASATTSVRVRPPNRPPTARIEGPGTVSRGSNATFRLRAADPDGRVSGVRWGSGAAGRTFARVFDEPAGTTVRLRATVTDDDGAATQATAAVRIVAAAAGAGTTPQPDTVPGDDAMSPPQVRIDGPLKVLSGSTHQYSANVTDPDDDVREVKWVTPDAVREGRTITRTFGRRPGGTVEMTALAEDARGRVGHDSVTVWITGEPSVAIRETPEGCVPAGSTHTLVGDATDPDGRIVSYTWRVDGEVVDHSASLTRTFGRSGGTRVTLTVTDEEGRSASTATTVCTHTEPENHAPEITSLSGVWYADIGLGNTQRDPHDAFTEVVESQWPVVHYEATATDRDGDQLTFYWRYGDGVSGRETPDDDAAPNSRTSSVSHSYDEQEANAGRMTTYPVTLIVEDEHGATTRASRTVSVLPAPTDNPRHYRLSASSKTVQAGETVTFYLETGSRTRRSEKVTKARVRFGDGRTKRVLSSNSTVSKVTHTYHRPGTYQVQVASVLDSERTRTTTLDDRLTVEVSRKQYTEYHYGVKKRITEVSKTAPGLEWSRNGVDHYEQRRVDVRRETAIAHSAEARKLERKGYHADGSWTERRQVGTEYVRSTSKPGSDWKLDERNVDTVRRQDGWKYRTTDNRLWATEWSFVETVRTEERVRQTETSASRPGGRGWTRDAVVGRQQDGWSRGRADDIGDVPSDGIVVDSDRDVVGKDVDYECDEWQRNRNIFGEVERDCVDWDREVDYEYDTDYEYKKPVYENVWRWERTVTIHDTDYRYRKPKYEQISRNQYRKPVFEQRTFVQYRRDVYETTPYYEWQRTVVVERTSLESPEENVEWIEEEAHDCPTGGELASHACSSNPSSGEVK